MECQIDGQVLSLLRHIKFTNIIVLSQAIETAKKTPLRIAEASPL